jgi:hypothetical protein
MDMLIDFLLTIGILVVVSLLVAAWEIVKEWRKEEHL